ncbi:MAG: hypothetical protein ACLQLH_02770 [Terracidiphilus sp.]
MPTDNRFPEEYATAIGLVVISWNRLEFLLNMFLIHLLGKDVYDVRAHTVFTHMAFPQKLDVLGALAEEKATKRGSSPRLKKCKATLLPLLKKAQAGRNWVIHSDWTAQDRKVTRASMSARGSFKFAEIATTLKEIEAVKQSIDKAYKELVPLAGPPWTKARRREMSRRKEGRT